MVMEKAVLQLFECSFVNKIVLKNVERVMTGNRPMLSLMKNCLLVRQGGDQLKL